MATGTAQVPWFVVGGGDTRLSTHPHYKQQHQQQRGDGADSSEPVCTQTVRETLIVYCDRDIDRLLLVFDCRYNVCSIIPV